MFRTITAEFGSTDEANAVSSMIVNRINSIKSTDIIGNSINKYNPYGHIGLANVNIAGKFLPYDYGFYGMERNDNALYLNGNTDDDFIGDIERNRSVTLKIVCPDNMLSTVSSILISQGGLNIKKY